MGGLPDGRSLEAEVRHGRVERASRGGRAVSLNRTAMIGVLLGAFLSLVSPAAADQAGKPRVLVTIKPVHSLVAGLLDGIATPELLIDGRASPHSYALKPSDARALNRADVFIRVSESVEPFTAKIIAGLPSSVEVVTLDKVPDLVLLKVRTGATFEAHAHGAHEEHEEHEHEHEQHGKTSEEHDKADAHAGEADHDHAPGAIDGHIWLDPANAKLIARYLEATLAKRFPSHKERLGDNARKLTERIDALQASLEQRLHPIEGRPFVVFHDAFQYFELRFGLAAAGAITVNPEVPPGAKRISALRAQISKLGARCVFAEPQFRAKVVNAIAEGTKARVGVLDPIGFDLAPGSDLYFSLMTNLAGGLEACLADPA